MREKEIDKWAIHAALVDLHFQTDSVRKCAAINDLLERAERNQFQATRSENEAWQTFINSNEPFSPRNVVSREIFAAGYEAGKAGEAK